MKPSWKHVVFMALTLLLTIAVLEAGLRVLISVSPQVEKLLVSSSRSGSTPPHLPDQHLRFRPNPAFPGHDHNGFRNPHVPATADVVTLGDSQTYGTGVRPDQAWPRLLGSRISQTVYSMAYGGYGPVHSLILWYEAIAFRPKVIIQAFYAGNDLYDAFNLVYNHGQHPELKSADPELQKRVRDAEAAESIEQHVTRMFRMGEPTEDSDCPENVALKVFCERSLVFRLVQRFQLEIERSRRNVYGLTENALLSSAYRNPWERAKAFAEAHPTYCEIFNDGRYKTVFTSNYRFSALNLNDPRINEGHLIALRAMQRMKRLAAEHEARFIVVLIPTKELVFQGLWSDPPPNYRKLTDSEAAVWRITKDFLERNGIEYADALPVLRRQFATGAQPYQVTHDGHPNENGHRLIASMVSDYLLHNPQTGQTHLPR